MRFGSLEIPEEVLKAQEEGTLVIFAGAGISRDSPAGLPDFAGLAKKIGEGTRLPYDGNENDPFDQYLGKLATDGVKVHSVAADIILKCNALANEYHRLIPQLFPAQEKIKIVTTNWDGLLQRAMT